MATSSRRKPPTNPQRIPAKQTGRNATWALVTLGISAVLLVLVGWRALGQGSTSSPNPATTSARSTAAGASNRALAPDFTLPLLGSGQPFHLAAEQGKATLMLFTASWCSDCLPEIPKLAQIYKEKGSQGLNVLVIDLDPTESDADFLGFKARAGGADHFWARDADGKVTTAYNVRATDTKVVIDRNGGIVATTVSPTSLETLRQYVDEALK